MDREDTDGDHGGRYLAFVRRRHRALLVGAALVAALGGLGASRLALHTGFQDLLPTHDPAGRALAEAERRLGTTSTLLVVVHGPQAEENRRYAARLADRIAGLGPSLVEHAIWRLPELPAFFAAHRWLYADESLLEGLRDRLRVELLERKNPFFVELDDPPTVDELRDSIEAQSGGSAFAHLPGGRLESPSGDLVAILVLPARSLGDGGEERLESAVRHQVDLLPPTAFDPAMRVTYGGEIHSAVVERHAIEQDVAVTSIAVVLLVGLVVGLYFGRLRAIPLMALPVLVAAVAAMGFAGLVYGALNASTAFLGGIIVGNGINYPILVLARYDEERARGRAVAEALRLALVGTARATALAAFAASLAYGSLAFTRFRGFSQFGVIAAVGMALCWVATVTVLPALLWALDRPRAGRAAAPRRLRRANYGEPLARAVERAPAVLLAVGTLLTIGSAVALPRWLADPYEYDFRHLHRVEGEGHESTPELDAIFGRALSPSVVLTETAAEAPQAAAAVLDQAEEMEPVPVERAVTVFDLLPGTPEAQRRKIALLDDIRHLYDPRALALLPPEKRATLERLRPPADVRPLDVGDLPPLARRPFTERDGTVGRVVLVYPPERGFSSWNGHDLIRLARAIRDVRLPDGRVVHGSGRAVTFASMIEAIAHDGPRATLASFAGVALLAALLLRRRDPRVARGGPAVVLAALALGVAWMLGVAAMADVKLNFLNFIALPITFGIGVDYAANVVLRYRREGAGSIAHVLRTTGGAVALNSATTMIGYGALLLAHNRALRSFGSLAILGELACVTVATLLVPAALALRDRGPLPALGHDAAARSPQ